MSKLLESDLFRNSVNVLFAVVSLFLFLAGTCCSSFLDSSSTWFLSALFAIPFLIHIVAWPFVHLEKEHFANLEKEYIDGSSEKNKVILKRKAIESFCTFFNVTMFLSILLYCVPWIVYCLVNSLKLSASLLPYFSYLCVAIILIQFPIIAFVTYIIMEIPRKESFLGIDLALLKRGLELCAFWRLAHFFAIFMCISFVFGFAFAFHDLDYRKNYPDITDSKGQHFANRALYVESLLSTDEIPGNNANQAEKNNTDSLTAGRVGNVENGVVPVCIYFQSGKAEFNDQ